MSRFDYVKYDKESNAKQAEIKRRIILLENAVEDLLPAGRAKSLVLTKLEEAYMWTGKAIRDEQVQHRGAELQEERSNE